MEERITSNPGILGGKPIIRGLRISVEMVLDLLSQGMDVDTLLSEYPVLKRDDVLACLRYAKELVACEEPEIALVGDNH